MLRLSLVGGAHARTPPARPAWGRRFCLPPQPSPAPHTPRALCLRRAFGAQTWLTRCQPPASTTTGGCEPDATDAEWITPATDLTLKGSGFGKQANPFRSNDGLRPLDGDYSAQLRGRQHQQTPNYYGRGGTQGAADGTGDLNKFNGYGSFTTLDTSFQRATASITALAAEDIDDPTKVATAMGLNTCTDPDGGRLCTTHNADSATCTAQTDAAGTACVFTHPGNTCTDPDGGTTCNTHNVDSATCTAQTDATGNTCTDPDGGTTCNAHNADSATCTAQTDATSDACVFTSGACVFTAGGGLTAAERETLGSAANTGGSDVEHGVLRCDVPKDSGGTTATHAWTKTAMTVDSVAFAPPLQGGSARLHRQVADFAEGTVCP